MTHPTDIQLVEWFDAPLDVRATLPISEHLSGCTLCSELIAAADPPELPGELEIEAPAPLEILSTWESVPEMPEKGQVWRVRWEDTSQLAMVWNAEVDWVGMIPVTPDPYFADDSCVILATEDSTGHSVLWLGLESPLPYHVLDAQVASLVTDDLDRVRTMWRQAKPLDDTGFTIGQPIVSAFDDRYEYRSSLGGDFGYLAGATWAPTAYGGDLTALASEAGVRFGTVAEILQLDSAERLRLRRGFRPLTWEEAERLSSQLNVDTIRVIECNPELDQSLIRALSRPKWRRSIDGLPRRYGESEAESRQILAYAVNGLAARESMTSEGEDRWHERISLYFAA